MKHVPKDSGHIAIATLRRTLGILAIVAVASCTDDGSSVAPKPLSPTEVEEARARELTRGLALALAAPDVRAGVRDAMRASPWTEHKLALTDFARTSAGQLLLEAAARARGVTLDVLRREIDALPALDFYMPVREHRRSWEGDANLVIVAAWEGAGEVPGYMPDGRVLSVSRLSPDGLPPIFFIQPSQPKGLRVNAQAATKGSVIEDANDGVGAEVFVWHDGRGDSTVIDFAKPDAEAKLEALRAQIALESERRSLLTPSFIEICDPSAIYCEPPPPPPPAPVGPRDTTRIAYFQHYMCDHTWCYEAGEFRWDAHLRPQLLVLADAYGSYYRDGLHHNTPYYLNVPLIFRRIVQGSSDYMDVHITEQDRGDWFGFNNDDDCGTVRLTWQSNNALFFYPNNGDCDGLWFGRSIAIEARYQWTPTTSW